MTPLIFCALAVAGGVGAATRYVVDGLVRSWLRTVFPWATFAINLTGSLALGLLTALTAGSLLPTGAGLIAGAGFLGGYTTFSTASYETVRLLAERRYAASLANGLGTLVICVGAAALGYWAGAAWSA